jgi:hypothetical protein
MKISSTVPLSAGSLGKLQALTCLRLFYFIGQRSRFFVKNIGTFFDVEFHRSDWNSTLILQICFRPTVAMKLQQFALTLIQRPHGLGALTANWIRE